MKKKIYRNICKVAFVAIILSFVLSTLLYYQKAEQQMKQEVRTEVHYLGVAVTLSGMEYFKEFAKIMQGKIQNRITVVNTNGIVIFDNYADRRVMGNHLNRPEILTAMESGAGADIRVSDTLLEKTYYYAIRLEDGTIIRGAATIKSVSASIYDMIPWILAVALIIGIISMIGADFQTKKIVDPINQLDIEDPDLQTVYEELSPLIRKIQRQRRMIQKQIKLLQEKKEEFEAITEHMQEGFLVIDKEERVISYNHSALRILGVEDKDKDLTGSHILRFHRSSQFCNAIESAITGKHAEYFLDIGERNYQLIANPVKYGDSYYGIIMVILDVTEKQSREAFRREFSANVSHELKTPLTSILGYADLLQNGMADMEDVGRFSAHIYREATRMTKLIEDIIQLSRLDEQSKIADEEFVDLYEVAIDIRERQKEQAKARNITVSIDGKPMKVYCVKQIIREMMDNLLDNAIKYNKDDGKVTIRFLKEKKGLILEVSDTGIGVSDEEQERIFERFYRSDKSHSKKIEGTGLGLSIVKRGALYHHAQIEFQSQEGEGTAIRIIFPRERGSFL